jgi:hypothetical protein
MWRAWVHYWFLVWSEFIINLIDSPSKTCTQLRGSFFLAFLEPLRYLVIEGYLYNAFLINLKESNFHFLQYCESIHILFNCSYNFNMTWLAQRNWLTSPESSHISGFNGTTLAQASDRLWLGVKAWLNGQGHYLWWQQFRHNMSGRNDGEKKTRMMVLQQD